MSSTPPGGYRPVARTREVTYHPDASRVFEALGGTQATDSALLESADITTKSSVKSVAVLSSSLRLTCEGQRVQVEILSPSGAVLAQRLQEQLGEYAVGENLYEFPVVADRFDERSRLTATSTVAPLRALTLEAGFTHEALPMLAGGFAFDYLGTFEELPEVAESSNTYPDYQFVLAETLLTIDHSHSTAHVSAVNAYGDEAELESLLDDVANRIANVSRETLPESTPAGDTLEVHVDISDEQFRGYVDDMKEAIRRGDIYQVVPARTFTLPCPDAFAAYRQLRSSNPSPYMFYVRGVDRKGEPYELFGASPESNLKHDPQTRQLQLYPIAGTRPRGLDGDGTINHELDIRRELELRTDAKEIAEHTMLVDLARNDLARVAKPGTRSVTDLLQVDRYSRVMHLVSRVTATLADGLDAFDAYRACMNMGTLTGAPKLRASELLRELEGTRRGSYGGAVGYVSGDGTMDNCIVIRSAYVSRGVASVQAGAGVVRDSNPQAEADETLHKAYAVLHAIAIAAGSDLKMVRS